MFRESQQKGCNAPPLEVHQSGTRSQSRLRCKVSLRCSVARSELSRAVHLLGPDSHIHLTIELCNCAATIINNAIRLLCQRIKQLAAHTRLSKRLIARFLLRRIAVRHLDTCQWHLSLWSFQFIERKWSSVPFPCGGDDGSLLHLKRVAVVSGQRRMERTRATLAINACNQLIMAGSQSDFLLGHLGIRTALGSIPLSLGV